jgi:hypothetical protein
MASLSFRLKDAADRLIETDPAGFIRSRQGMRIVLKYIFAMVIYITQFDTFCYVFIPPNVFTRQSY